MVSTVESFFASLTKCVVMQKTLKRMSPDVVQIQLIGLIQYLNCKFFTLQKAPVIFGVFG